MGDINHLRLVVSGSNADIGEDEWQFGHNLMPTLAAAMDDIYTPAGDFDASSDNLTSSGTGWSGTSNFLLEGGVSDINPLDYLEDQVLAALTTFFATTNAFGTGNKVNRIQAYPIGTDGKVISLDVGPAKAEIEWSSSQIAGSGSGIILAPFTSFAISTYTAANLRRGRGRFYPPPTMATSAVMDVKTGLMLDAFRATYATAAKTYVNDLKLASDPTYVTPCVIGSPWTTAYKITRVRVNNIPDTQRRRKNAITPLTTEETL